MYETNLTNLIKDLRIEFNVPNLPVSIGNTGMANGSGGTVLVAQMNVGNPVLHPEFAGTVTTVDTRPYDYGEALGTSTENYHWYRNAESYFNIGWDMGQAMMAMLPASSTPYSTWAAANGLTAGVNDGQQDDPDHDGMNNQQEFAFGLNPLSGKSCNPITVALNQTAGTFTYSRNATSGLTYTVLYSTDLATWNQDTGASQTAGAVDGSGNQAVTVTLSSALRNQAKLFVRVQAQ